MKQLFLSLAILVFLLSSCIKDDFIMDTVEPVLRITSSVDTIALNSSFSFDFQYLNNIGQEEPVNATWQSSNPDIISIDGQGTAEALQLGSSTISVSYSDGENTLTDAREVHVGNNTVMSVLERSGTIQTTSSYRLTGDFTLREEGDGVILEFGNDYEASSSLPGLYVYLTNNPNTTANAVEIGAVQVFSGQHAYQVPDVGINDYNYVLYFCKPFNVKVGDGEIMQ